METARPLSGGMTLRRYARWWGIIIGFLLLTGCLAAPSPPPTARPLPTLGRAPATATATPRPTVTPSPAPSPTPLACWQAGGQIRRARLRTVFLDDPMPVLVYLPPCYDAQPARRYPVLYLIHGQNFNEHQWVQLGATTTADRLIAAGEIPPFIIVMPGERQWKQPRDTGWDEAFLQILMPWVDTHFRTLPDREHRAVGGLSRGASWAIHFGLSHPELFGSIGGHSPPVFWEDVRYIRIWLERLKPAERPRIYLDIGDQDGMGGSREVFRSAVWFEDLLTAEGFPHEWHLNVGAHTEAYWSAHVADYLRWYTAPWQDTP